MDNKIFIGSHVSMSSPDYYLSSVKEALSYGANTFMFYTGAPQNSFRLPLEKLKIKEGQELIKASGIDQSKIVVHAPYIINIANKLNEDNYELAKRVLASEIKRTSAFGCKTLVLHPGSHVNTSVENGISSIINALNSVLDNDDTGVRIALETMAGKGSEMGTSFEQMKTIIDGVNKKDRVGICLDTCHISDNGFDLSNFDSILNEIEKTIGLDKLFVVHVNDSKNEINSHKDRHENLGYGTIGFQKLSSIVHNEKLKDIPFELETPYVNGEAPYKIEIEMLRKNEFVDWKK